MLYHQMLVFDIVPTCGVLAPSTESVLQNFTKSENFLLIFLCQPLTTTLSQRCLYQTSCPQMVTVVSHHWLVSRHWCCYPLDFQKGIHSRFFSFFCQTKSKTL